MGLTDVAGLVGVALMLGAYAAAAMGRLDPAKALALSLNLIGACLVLLSLRYSFNLSAAVMEGAWGFVALVGLIRLMFKSRR